jgi:hypothetical protein
MYDGKTPRKSEPAGHHIKDNDLAGKYQDQRFVEGTVG